MRRWTQFIAIALVTAGASTALAETVLPTSEEMLAERSLGAADAPVTIVEYSSLTCGHCAALHRDTLPLIKERYIDTGKARMVYHDFPLNDAALAAAMLTRCAPPDSYFELLETMFREQENWSQGEDVLGSLTELAGGAGLPPDGVRACLSNGKLLTGILERATTARKELGIESTPTLVINGEVVAGALPFERFAEIIDGLLGDEDKATDAAPGSDRPPEG